MICSMHEGSWTIAWDQVIRCYLNTLTKDVILWALYIISMESHSTLGILEARSECQSHYYGQRFEDWNSFSWWGHPAGIACRIVVENWNFWDLGTRCTWCVQELIGPSRCPFCQNLKGSEYKVKCARQGDPRDSSNQWRLQRPVQRPLHQDSVLKKSSL